MRDGTERRNPFQLLYVTEALEDAEVYSRWFSPRIITGETASLFRQGNTILLGSNGAGKTMLLRLFAPEVQAAFLRSGQEAIPREDQRFLGIGIHIIHAGLGAWGGRHVVQDPEESRRLWPLMLGDVMNYHLVGELLRAIQFLQGQRGGPLAKVIGWNGNSRNIAQFVRWLARQDCWYGALREYRSLESLQAGIRRRISQYQSFVNWNIDRLPAAIQKSKTEVATPLIVARLGISEHGLLDSEVPLMVAIDQYESLIHTDYETERDPERAIGRAFCRVVNSFVASRNPTVSYKVGVRPYSWGRELRGLGTDARLEEGRDFHVVSLDAVLRRRENTAAWIFPRFAEDVAKRRIAVALGSKEPDDHASWLEQHLEKLRPDDELDRYCKGNPERLQPHAGKWPPVWRDFIKGVYAKSKFDARIVEVWLEQEKGRSGAIPDKPPSSFDKGEWAREWWQKERREAILVQAASACRQRRLYGGLETVHTLSGSNILVFITLCREIWDYWDRAKAKSDEPLQTISPDIQSQAIWVVSDTWLKKQDEFPHGSRRRDFVTRLGIGIRKALLADRGLVYPGHTGFSLLLEEYESDAGANVREFLETATDFGALVSFPHTTKEKDRRRRQKWYLFPTLCPQFEIPAIRTKEPYYATLEEVERWLGDRRTPILLTGPRAARGHVKEKRTPDSQLGFFESGSGDEDSE